MTEHVFTRRLIAQERNALLEHYRPGTGGSVVITTEPALGTLAERLDIIIRRLGGRTRAPRMTRRERREYAEWCREQGIPNPLDDQ